MWSGQRWESDITGHITDQIVTSLLNTCTYVWDVNQNTRTPISHNDRPRVDVSMGRVKDFKELGKRGPGRKSKKQSDPGLEGVFEKTVEVVGKIKKKTGGRIKQRIRKRVLKKVANEVVKGKKERKRKKNDSETVDEDEQMEMMEFLPEDLNNVDKEESEEGVVSSGFTDDNQTWLKPKKEKKKKLGTGKKKKSTVTNGGSDGEDDGK